MVTQKQTVQKPGFLNIAYFCATTYRQLAEMPGMGSPRDYGQDFSDLRVWPVPKFPKCLIFDPATETELTIIRVLHGAQNIAQIFSDPERG
jgi:plasmid stabilization system protein ParE